MPPLCWDPDTEITSLDGKVILVTGGTAGLGRETILSFAKHDAKHIYFTGRSQPSADKVVSEVKQQRPDVSLSFVKCDLASLASVREAARNISKQTDRLDIVMLNAGVMALPPGQTKEDYEVQFGTNHVGHALLVKLLTPSLETTAKQTGDVRLVWNTSQGYGFAAHMGICFEKLKTPQKDISPLPFGILAPWFRYGQSKIANLLYARAYAKHHPAITSVSIHPGVSATGLVTGLDWWSKVFVYVTSTGTRISAEDCAKNQQWAATAPKGIGEDRVESGCYYEPVGKMTKPMGLATDDELAEKLWSWTEKELEDYKL